MGRYSGRDRKPARKKANARLEPKLRILVVCEGLTEKQYLDQFTKLCRNPLVLVQVSGQVGVPLTVVTKARDAKQAAEKDAKRHGDDFLKYDAVWCVVDVDDHPNLAAAQVMARDNKISMAISNPSFELWLLLHFRDSPGMQTRAKIRSLLKEHLPDYDKHIYLNDTFWRAECFHSRYAMATQTAKRLDKQCGDEQANPTTGVYVLTEEIRA